MNKKKIFLFDNKYILKSKTNHKYLNSQCQKFLLIFVLFLKITIECIINLHILN